MAATTKDSSNPVTANVALSGINIIDSLIGGTKWGGDAGTGATIYFSFPTSGSITYWSNSLYTYDYANAEPFDGFRALNSTQQAAATSALQAWANVANITIQKVTETTSKVGDIRFATTNGQQMDETTYAFAYYPAQNNPIGGDIWLNPSPPANGNNYSVGAAGYHTLLHEIGHALGLSHSFQEDVSDASYLPTPLEYYQYTVMSYSDAPGYEDTGYSGYYPTTPMLLDVQAIQYLYGANMSYRTGNDTYVFNGTGKYYQTIWDAGGTDTIKYVSNTGGLINLAAGEFSELGAPFRVDLGSPTAVYQYQNIAIAFNVKIENAIGGNGADYIFGNEYDNRIEGGGGVDALYGGDGDDTYVINFTKYYAQPLDLATGVYSIKLQDSYYEYLDEGVDTVKLNGIDLTAKASTIALLSDDNMENLDASATGATKLDLVGNSLNNQIIGNSAKNSITGGSGHDTLDGGTGIDTLVGGAGEDTYVVDVVGDVILETGGDVDTVITKFSANLSSVQFLNIENLTLFGSANLNATGNSNANLIIGNSGANVIDGGASSDDMQGMAGSDTYIVDHLSDQVTEQISGLVGGVDTVKSSVSFSLGYNIEKLVLTGDDHINGHGNELNNTITGNAGNNGLEGGTGIDTMAGGAGDDEYVDIFEFSNVGTKLISKLDTIIEKANEGIDTVKLLGGGSATGSVKYMLAENVENLEATVQSPSLFHFVGNKLGNYILASDYANILDGAAGVDTLAGGYGDDTYYVDLIVSAGNAILQDTIIENDDFGSDTLKLRGILKLTNYTTLSLEGLELENIDASATSTTKLHLIGNEEANWLIGNSISNSLFGGAGNDTLDGGAGADSMVGGAGNDIYKLNQATDTVSELTDEGIDTIEVNFNVSLLDEKFNNIEHVKLIGTVAKTATGDAANNKLEGNTLNNTLIGNEGVDTLLGGAGVDILNGGLGADELDGGLGNDTYLVDDEGDTIIETFTLAEKGGVDLVKSAITSTLGINLDNLILTDGTLTGGEQAIDGTGNELNNSITGNAGNNVLKGGDGKDTITGGAGNDTIYGGTGNDVLIGGTGYDVFVFDTPNALNPLRSLDIIKGFNVAEDKILLDLSAFPYLVSVEENEFRIGSKALDLDDRIIFNKSTGALYYDEDGSGLTAAYQFATLTSVVGTLTANNFNV